ncbi:hypothetical protein [Jiangella asiatica]|uniref:Uncharacterized protein n=1 Tax=Jiangella asiatica TaxID=2530372 RepID=A0A4R5DDW2_9ACTN|nr:hypothetical protein [Jiangella asiatica]TDE10150.1 hypothetical protein E1269_12605 [Jiangella asiatica]
MSDDIPNPYLAALREARDDAGPVADGIREELRGVKDAMDAGAWVSSAADEFYTALTTQNTRLDAAADEAISDLDSAIEGRPEMVPPDSRDGRWKP